MDQWKVEDIVEQGHAAKDQNRLQPARRLPVQQRQHQQGRPQRHQQIRKRGRIFVAVQEREDREQRILLRGPGSWIAIEVRDTQQDKQQRQSAAQKKQPYAPFHGFAKQQRTET